MTWLFDKTFCTYIIDNVRLFFFFFFLKKNNLLPQKKTPITSQVLLTMIKSIVSKSKTDPVLYKGSIRLWKWPNYYTNIRLCILGRSDTIIIIKNLYLLSAKVGASLRILKTKYDPYPESLPSSPSTNLYTHWNTQQVFLPKPRTHPHWY